MGIRIDRRRKLVSGVTTTEELAWAAGFFDGEGCVFLTKPTDRSNLRIRLSISQVDRECLDRFRSAILGLGRVNGPYAVKGRPSTKIFSKQPQHRYSLDGFEKVQAAVTLLWSWLGSAKRFQATIALLTWRDQLYGTVS